MARIGSAHLREESASAQGSLTGLGTWLKQSALKEGLASDRWLQAAAALHLTAIAAAVLGPSSPPLPIFLTVTGLALVVLALTRSQASPRSEGHMTPSAAGSAATRHPEQAFAEAAIRARHEADMRSQLWAELTARMSHELRTPLNAVIGFSDLMGAELFGPLGHDRYRDYTRHIRECSRTLLKCTEDTLALTSSLAKRETVETARSVCLDGLIRDATEFHAADFTHRGVKVSLPAATGSDVIGEARPIRQILINLLSEAAERTRCGGQIAVDAVTGPDTITLSIVVQKAQPRADEGQAPLAICIARILLEQLGSALTETDDHDRWQATTTFHRPAQSDFFGPN